MGKRHELWDILVYEVRTHNFSQKIKEMFANIVMKKDHGDCFLGQSSSGTFPRMWFINKFWKILWNIIKVKKRIQNKHQWNMSSKILFFHDNNHQPMANCTWELSNLRFWSCAWTITTCFHTWRPSLQSALRCRYGTAGRCEWVIEVLGCKILWWLN